MEVLVRESFGPSCPHTSPSAYKAPDEYQRCKCDHTTTIYPTLATLEIKSHKFDNVCQLCPILAPKLSKIVKSLDLACVKQLPIYPLYTTLLRLYD